MLPPVLVPPDVAPPDDAPPEEPPEPAEAPPSAVVHSVTAPLSLATMLESESSDSVTPVSV